jgi:hypothetical protein
MRSLFGLSLRVTAAALLALGCGEGASAPSNGALQITTATSGPEPDPDGYTVIVDGVGVAAIGINATLRDENVFPGPRRAELVGLAENCTAAGDNPRQVDVEPGATVVVVFLVTCGPTTGALQVTTITSGAAPDPDGYVLRLDGKAMHRIRVNTTEEITRLFPASYTVGLGDVASNCQVKGEHPRTVTLAAGATLLIDFMIDCP